MAELVHVESPEQIAAIASLARDIWTDHYVPIVGKKQVDYMLEKFQSEMAIGTHLLSGHEYFLLQHNGDNAGYIGMIADDDNMMISKLYVSDSARGNGYGRKMIRFAEEQCRDRGLTHLWLTVNKNNITSIEWYLRAGFTNAGPIVMDIGGGFVMDDYRMEKHLQSM